MSYSSVVGADFPVGWFRLIEGGGYSRNVGSDEANLYSYNVTPIVGFSGVADDGGSVCLPAGATMAAYPVSTIAAAEGHSLEGWLYVQGEVPFNPATTDYPLQLFIDSANGFQLGITASTQLVSVRDPSHTASGATATTASSFGWHHVCATREAGSNVPMHLYVDGTLVGSSAAYTSFGVTEPVRFNLITSPTASSLFVAEPAFYYRELTATQVAAHAAAFDTLAAPRFIQRLPGVCQ